MRRHLTLILLLIASAMSPPTERYFRAARDAGMADDQIRNLLRARVILQARQMLASGAARLCDRPCDHPPEAPCHVGCAPTEIGYGGARGGGKSHWGLAQIFCDDCARYPNLKFLYLRKVGKAGKEAVQDLRREVLHSTPHEYKAGDGILIRKDNGSRVVLGHFQNEKDVDNYLGLQYDGALIEEATQLSSRKITDIGTCIRSSKPGWRPRTYYTTNPGNIGHAWFKAKFIDPLRAGTEAETRFVQATVRDNAFVNAGYRSKLEKLTGWQRRAWLDGDWDFCAGQFFTTFSHGHHCVSLDRIPDNWRVWLGFDYGFNHYTAAYLLAQTGDGIVYVVDEHAERGWLPERHAAAILAMLARWDVEPCRLETIQAGHDVFDRDHRGGTIADDYAELGLTLERANNDRVNGAAAILRRLGDPASADRPSAPTLFFSDRCKRLLECLPALQHDPRRGEDVLKVDCDDDGLGGDDYYDAFRYGLMHVAGGPGVSVSSNPFTGYRG